uniref:Uncharacterized protein n=1 Tax=Ascaris lumbricoides TaxID=6252 RepID=A0A0M3IPQ2_ASCLU
MIAYSLVCKKDSSITLINFKKNIKFQVSKQTTEYVQFLGQERGQLLKESNKMFENKFPFHRLQTTATNKYIGVHIKEKKRVINKSPQNISSISRWTMVDMAVPQ